MSNFLLVHVNSQVQHFDIDDIFKKKYIYIYIFLVRQPMMTWALASVTEYHFGDQQIAYLSDKRS